MRRRFGLVLLLLLVAAAVEIAVAIVVAHVIGWAWTLVALLALSALGGWLLRREGGRAWRTFREDAQARRAPGNSATDGVLVLAGGVFMVVPGFVSGVIGLLLLLPPTRYPLRRLVQRLLAGRISPAAANTFFGPRRVRVRPGQTFEQYPTEPVAHQSPNGTRPLTTAERPIEGEVIDP